MFTKICMFSLKPDNLLLVKRVVALPPVREVTTVTVDRTEAGDTVFRSVVTDRERLRDRVAVSDVRVLRSLFISFSTRRRRK